MGNVDLIATYADHIGNVLTHPLGMWIPVVIGFGLLVLINYKDRSGRSIGNDTGIVKAEPEVGGSLSNPLTHTSVRIADLADQDNKIRNQTFEHCTLYGPAVVFFTGVIEISLCRVEEDPESVLLQTSDNKPPTGAINFVDCTFRRCTFRGIGIAAGTQESLQQWREKFIFTDYPQA